MKTVIVSVLTINLFVLLPILGVAQKFNKTYDILPGTAECFNIEQIDSNRFVYTAATSTNTGLAITHVTIDSIGDTISTSTFKHPGKSLYVGWGNAVDLAHDSGLILGGGIADSVAYGLLVKFDQKGDTLWTKIFGDSVDFHNFRQAIPTKDGGYVAVGSNRRGNNDTGGWIVKTDSVGNLEWERIYRRTNEIMSFTSVVEMKNGNFAVAGDRRHFAGNPKIHNYDPLMMKLTSQGRQIWTYINNTLSSDGVANITETLDGNLVYVAGLSVKQNDSTQAAIVKIDARSHNEIWSKRFGVFSEVNFFNTVKQLEDSSIIAVGAIREDFSSSQGYVAHVDKNGNTLFEKRYLPDTAAVSSSSRFWDVIQLEDKGFMLCGRASIRLSNNDVIDDPWVVRIDSNGCAVINCLLTDLPKMEDKERNEINLYPNPSAGMVYLKSNQTFAAISLYNLQGQLVQEISGNEKSFQLPEQKGIYLLRMVTQKGEVISKKVIRE